MNEQTRWASHTYKLVAVLLTCSVVAPDIDALNLDRFIYFSPLFLTITNNNILLEYVNLYP